MWGPVRHQVATQRDGRLFCRLLSSCSPQCPPAQSWHSLLMVSFRRDLSKVSATFTFRTFQWCDVCYHCFSSVLCHSCEWLVVLVFVRWHIPANKGRAPWYLETAVPLPCWWAGVWWGRALSERPQRQHLAEELQLLLIRVYFLLPRKVNVFHGCYQGRTRALGDLGSTMAVLCNSHLLYDHLRSH